MGLSIVFPLFYALSMSLMPPHDIFSLPAKLIASSPSLENYRQVTNYIPVGRFLINSFLVSLAVTIGQLITSSLAAFAFSHFEFRGRDFIFFLFLGSLMIPGEAVIISNYLNVSKLGLSDSYLGLIVPHLVSAFGIFIMRQYYLSLPKALYESARIDGMTDFKYFLKILLPLSRPVFVSYSIYSFLNTWNQYLWPLLITNSDEKRTVQIGISMLKFAEGLNFGLLMAGIVIIILPSIVIFIAGYKYLVEGLTEGSIKG